MRSTAGSLRRLAEAIHGEWHGCLTCAKRKQCQSGLACDAYQTYFNTGLWPRWDCEETRFPSRDAYEHVFLESAPDQTAPPLDAGQNVGVQPGGRARRARRKKAGRRRNGVRHMRETLSSMLSMVLDAEE